MTKHSTTGDAKTELNTSSAKEKSSRKRTRKDVKKRNKKKSKFSNTISPLQMIGGIILILSVFAAFIYISRWLLNFHSSETLLVPMLFGLAYFSALSISSAIAYHFIINISLQHRLKIENQYPDLELNLESTKIFTKKKIDGGVYQKNRVANLANKKATTNI
jgi:hypothetical protein